MAMIDEIRRATQAKVCVNPRQLAPLALAQIGDTVEEHGRRQGTGLGLAICRQIVEHYKGRVWAESELGRGSTFILELPLAGPPGADDGQDQLA